MAYWLFKSEPDSWSWTDQVAAGAKGQEWDGVRNPQAQSHMKAMKRGDRGFFYHTGGVKAVIGIVEVIGEAHPEKKDPAWQCVDLAAREELPSPVTLASVKADAELKDMVLARAPRLSVQPVTEAQWKRIRTMGGLKA